MSTPEKSPREIVHGFQGKIGEMLVYKSIDFRKQIQKGWEVVKGHEPKITFSNLSDVLHLDFIAYDRTSNQIRAIYEVKSTTYAQSREFITNGQCAAVLVRAQAARIPIFLAVVRLRNRLPESVCTADAARRYEEFLRQNPNEYSITFYDESEFIIRGAHVVLMER
jgi:hypothetical protein